MEHVLITGASRGLGEAVARAFWKTGVSLLLVARNRPALERLAQEFEAEKCTKEQEIFIFPADLAQPETPEAVQRFARAHWPSLEVLINNAAILGPVGPAWTNSAAAWEETLRVNLMAPVALCRQMLPWMIEARRGKLIQLSGGGATSPRPNFSAYATAKAGLVRFSETLAVEAAPWNIQVNCVAPGAMNTQMVQQVLQIGAEQAGEREFAVAQRVAAEDDAVARRAAELCLYLASPAADGISGRLISAVWDDWALLHEHAAELQPSDIFTLRRITPEERGKQWKK